MKLHVMPLYLDWILARKMGIVRETSPLLGESKQLGKVPLKADDGDVEVLHVN
jgi:hypothetical protein